MGCIVHSLIRANRAGISTCKQFVRMWFMFGWFAALHWRVFLNPYGENEWEYSHICTLAVFCDKFKTHQLCFVVLFWSKVILLSKHISQRASRLIYSLHNCFHDHFQLSLSLTLDVWCGPAVLLMNIKHSIFINFIMLCVSANPSTTPPLSNPRKPFCCLKIKTDASCGKTPWLF